MPQLVDVPTVGTVEFPDGMGDRDIALAIYRNYPHLRPDRQAVNLPQIQSQEDFNALPEAHQQIIKSVAGFRNQFPELLTPNTDTLTPTPGARRMGVPLKGRAPTVKELFLGPGDNLAPEDRPANLEERFAPEPATPTAPLYEKTARGLARGSLRAADAMNPMLVMAAPAIPGGVAGRVIGAGFAATQAKSAFDAGKEMVDAVKANDPERFAAALVTGGVGAFFAYHGAKGAVAPGLANESPWVRSLVEKQIETQYSPAQLKEIYGRVNQGKATPEEESLVRFINESPEPGQAVRQGVTTVQPQPTGVFGDYLLARGRFAKTGQPVPTAAPQPEEANATATREEPVRVQPERERVDEELQNQGADRQQPAVQPQESVETIAGNRLPAVGSAVAIPDWARQEMIRRGLNPGRTFNDVDLGNPSIRQAIQSDPTLTPEQKQSLLTSGGLPIKGGDVSGQEKQKQEGQVPVLSEPPPVVPAAPPVATTPTVPKVAPTVPAAKPAQFKPEEWRVTVQQPELPGMKVYVQYDRLLKDGQTSPMGFGKLQDNGITQRMPDFSGLPTGQYTFDQAQRMLTAKKKEDHTREQSRQGPALAPREQKKYLLAELDKAIGEAPDEAPASGTALEHEKQMAAIRAEANKLSPSNHGAAQRFITEKVAASGLLEHYGIPLTERVKGGTTPAQIAAAPVEDQPLNDENRIRLLNSAIDAAIEHSRPHVTIHVPGDGTFSVVNRKVSLEQFRKEVSKRFPVSTPSGAVPERRLPEPSKLPTVKENLTVADAVKALDVVASRDASRTSIGKVVMADGKQLVATDGRRMLVIRDVPGIPGTAKKVVILSSETGKPKTDYEGNYPNWRQVIPERKLTERQFKNLPTDSLFSPLKQALVLQKDTKVNSVRLYRNADGSAGLSTKVPDVGEYEHNLQPGATVIAEYNTEYLFDAIVTARQTGSANVDIYAKDELSPIEIVGKHSQYVLMPMRMGQLAAAKSTGLESEIATEPVSAIGVEEIRKLVSNDTGLPEPVKKAMLAMLDSPVMRDLDWTGLKLELHDRIEGGFGGAVSGQLIEMSRQESSPSTFPHEVFHLLWQLLPPHVRTEIDAMRVRSMQAELQTIGDPNARQQVATLFGEWAHQPWTSDQFMQLMEALRQSDPQLAVGLPDFYHLLNPSEFLSWFASERFGQEQAAKEGQQSLWQKIKEWLAGLLKAIKGMLNLKRHGMEQIYQDLLAGRYRNTVASGVEYERQASLAKPSKGEHTQVMGEDEYVRSRPHLTPESHAASLSKAKQLFDAAGVPVTENAALGGWEIQNDGFEHNIEGRKLAGLLEKEIGLQNQPGKAEDYLASVLNSIVLNFEAGKMDQVFDLTVRNKLFEVSQSERSFRGRMLSALAQFGKGMEFVARNPDVMLGRIYSDAFGGDQLRAVMGRMLDEFRGYFTDTEIEQALKDTPDLQRTVDQLVALNRRDEGGRVYRRVQQLLKPKQKAKLAKLEANARVEEAVRDILQQAAKQGIHPKPNPNKKLSALQRLLLMVDPKTAPAIQKLVDKAVKDAEHNAGIAAALKEAATQAERQDLEGRFAAGEEPTAEQVDAGLSLPQFSHWKVIRDNLLGYSPVTLKLAGEVVPKLKELIKQVFETPFYRQADLKENFADVMGKQLGVTEEQLPSLWKAFEQAFDTQLQKARQKAVSQIRTSMLPAEEAVLNSKLGKSGAQLVYQAVERLVNAYDWSMDDGELLLQIARARGELTMSKEELKSEFEKIRALVDREEHLRELTDKQKEGLTEKEILAKAAEKAAFNDGTRAALKKEMAVRWARITKPINLPMASIGAWRHPTTEGKQSLERFWNTRRNFAAAADEWAAGGLLLKIGFPTRQLVQVASQMLTYTPGRALAQAEQLHKDAIARNEPSALLELMSMQLKDGYVQRTAAIRATVHAIKASAMGRSEQRNVDRLMSGIAALDRLQLKADEFIKRGEVGRGRLLQALALQRLGYKVAQALDQMQGVPAEFQERKYLVIRELRQSGMSLAEARLHADFVIGDMNLQYPLAFDRAQAMAQHQGEKLSDSVLKERAWQLVRVWQVERMKALQLPVDDFAARIELLKNTLGYNEPETKGLGGLVALSMNAGRKLTQEIGLPTALFPFGNAIGITINRLLAFTPFYWQANIGPGESGWFHTDTDKKQRRWEGLAIGPIFGGILAALVALGYWVVRGSYPKDEAERELWDARGTRPHTLEVGVGDGVLVLSLNNSPITPFSPYLAGAGALVDLLDRRQKEQDKLNAEAAKLGLQPGTIRPMDMADMLGVAASAAYQTVMGGRTASGLIGSLSDFGQLNVTKALASRVSPFVPGLPALQELSRMGGVVLDTKMASFWDFMLPLPTSGARKVNMLGDPVGTQDAAQRVFQVLTGGSYPYVANDQGKTAAYASLFASGYRPPSVNPGKGYNVNGTFRPLNDEELAKYTALRGELAKQKLTALGVTDDPKAVQAVFQQANAEALQSVGVTLTPRQEQQAAGSQPTTGGVRTAAGAIGGGAVAGGVGGLKARASGLGRGLRRGLGRSVGRGLGRTRGLRISRGRRGIARGLRSK